MKKLSGWWVPHLLTVNQKCIEWTFLKSARICLNITWVSVMIHHCWWTWIHHYTDKTAVKTIGGSRLKWSREGRKCSTLQKMFHCYPEKWCHLVLWFTGCGAHRQFRKRQSHHQEYNAACCTNCMTQLRQKHVHI